MNSFTKTESTFKFRAICLSLAFIFCVTTAMAQLTTYNDSTPDQAVQTLLGDGVLISNIEYIGDSSQIGLFDCNSCGIDIDSGVIMASGDVQVAEGPNDSGSATLGGGSPGASDPDLEQTNPDYTFNDAAVLEFDFVAAGDSINFNYVWASEEYPEFSNSSFNDAFAFFLSGPGIDGTFSNDAVNIAQIPGSELAVSINNLNNGIDGENGPCEFCELYTSNTQASHDIQFDGFTVTLSANIGELQTGETYHIKIALADAGDSSYDSGVFIQAESLNSNKNFIELNVDEPTPLGNSTVVEGCGSASFEVVRSAIPALADTVYLNFEGSAVNGMDVAEIPPYVVIESGENSVEVPIETLGDSETEGLETLTIEYLHDSYTGNANTISITLSIVDIDVSVNSTENSLIAGEEGEDVEYQWLNCENDFEEIPGENGQEFFPTENGTYAVSVSKYNCDNTSDCIPFTTVGIEDMDAGIVSLYPNPTSGEITISSKTNAEIKGYVVKNFLGRVVDRADFENKKKMSLRLNEEAGIYFIQVFTTDGKSKTYKVLKK